MVPLAPLAPSRPPPEPGEGRPARLLGLEFAVLLAAAAVPPLACLVHGLRALLAG